MCLIDIQQLHDVGMLEPSHDVDFALQVNEAVEVGEGQFADNLDRHFLTCLDVVSRIDCPRRPLSDQIQLVIPVAVDRLVGASLRNTLGSLHLTAIIFMRHSPHLRRFRLTCSALLTMLLLSVQSCQDAEYAQNGRCLSCPTNCRSCTPEEGRCLKCQDGYAFAQ